jgi:hypothetical protein
MALKELLVLYEKLTNDNGTYDVKPLKIKDGCAAEAKFFYRYKLEYLIYQLIENEDHANFLEDFIFKYEKIRWAHYNITLALYRKYLSLNPTNAKLFKKFSEYLLLRFHAYPESVEAAKQISHFVDLQEFDKALELVNKNI